MAETASSARTAAVVRAQAARTISQVMRGRSLSEVLPVNAAALDPASRPLLAELVHGTCRWYFRLDYLARQLLVRPLKPRDADIRALLLAGLYQLLFMRVRPHAAVHETVQAARLLGKPWAAGLLNALLRRVQRERDTLLAGVAADPQARFATPGWLIAALRAAWPERWQSVLDALNDRPSMTLRLNLARGTRDAYLRELAGQGIQAQPHPIAPTAVVLAAPLEVLLLPGFAQGRVSVQDAGAQLCADLLELVPGQRVLDACAAPGGKSGALLEACPGISLTAVDVDAVRLQRVRDNLARLALAAQVEQGDAAHPQGPWAASRYQRILLDVPCSASGVIRRHPDIRLLRRLGDVKQLAERQAQILDAVWSLLEPGGMLLYVTCSLLPAENEEQISRFLARQPDATERCIEAAWGERRQHGRQILPDEADMDGFFYSLLEKRIP